MDTPHLTEPQNLPMYIMVRGGFVGALQLNHLQHYPNRAGLIRRVLRVNGHYVCGICRRSHEGLQDATSCLSECFTAVMQMNPVVTKRWHGHTSYRCRFCARDYDANREARSCAEQCKRKFLKKAELESSFIGDDEPKPRKIVRKAKPVIVPVAAPIRRQAPVQSVAEEEPVEELEDDTISADADESAVAMPETTVQAADDKPAKKEKPAEMFYRDQAKYVCTICHEKYFTKIEVTNCFEAHD